MKKVLWFALVIPALIGMVACSSASKVDRQNLEGKWTIVAVKGEKVTKEKMPYIEFDMSENRVHGNAGCNIFNTILVPDAKVASAFTLKAAAATMMACPDMETEGAILATIESIAGVKAGSAPEELALIDKNGETLLLLSKQ